MNPVNYDGKGAIRVGSLKIRASHWPWQRGYNWRGMTSSSAPLNAGGARFGGGWRMKLGFALGGTTLMVDLLFGMLTISIETAKDRRRAAEFSAWQQRERAKRAAATASWSVNTDIPF